jgi:error-prone DNA polymerase
MGFYQPAQLVRDAREHGVTVLPIDVNHSAYDCRLERNHRLPVADGQRSAGGGRTSPLDPARSAVAGPALRLGMRLINGISQAKVEGIERARCEQPFTSVGDLVRRAGASPATLARLAAADAMRSMGLDRRRAVWQVLALSDDPPLLDGLEPEEPEPVLPEMSLDDVVFADYEATGLSLNAHPVSLVRLELKRLGVQQNRVLKHTPQGRRIRVSGLVLVRQRPGTAGGIVFGTLEDETGTANLIIRPQVYEKYRRVAHGSVALIAEGRVERQGEVIHVQVTHVKDMSKSLAQLRSVSRDFH